MNDTATVDFSSAGAVYMDNFATQIQWLRVLGATPDASLYIRNGTDLITSTLSGGSTGRPFGYIVQQGGRVRVIGTFGLDSRYTVTGGELVIQGFPNIGGMGTTRFEQLGGTVTLDREVSLGNFATSNATFAVSGGVMNAYALQTSVGTTRFLHTGGVTTFRQLLRIGTASPNFRSALDVTGGSLTTGLLHLGSNGAADVNLSGRGAVFAVTDRLSLFDTAFLTVQPGFELRMNAGDLFNESVSPERLAGLANLTVRYEGDDVGTFEVAGLDSGPLENLRQADFALSALRVGVERPGRLRLSNQFDNHPDSELPAALYVEHLELGPNSLLELSGYNVYVGSMSIDPTVTILAGGAALSVRRPTRASTAFSEPAPGAGSYIPLADSREVGFTTNIVPTSGTQPLAAVAAEPGQLSPYLSHRSVQATTTFSPVSLQYIHEATVTLSVQVAATEYEAGDYLHAYLTNGSETFDLLNLQGAAGSDPLEALAGDGFLLYMATLPAGWQSAQLVVSSSSNSSTGAERFDFDGFGIHGIYAIPEPSGVVLAFAAMAVALCQPQRSET